MLNQVSFALIFVLAFYLTILLFDPHYCSGMPECKLGLNDRVLLEAQGRATKGKAIDLEDIKFHQYVI